VVGQARRVRFRAAAALRYNDRQRAAAGLRGQLRVMAATVGATADWSTLTVEGPVETHGLYGAVWFEWSATVAVTGGRKLPDDGALDAAVRPAGSADADVKDTAPQRGAPGVGEPAVGAARTPPISRLP
jgi:hypothetical protein